MLQTNQKPQRPTLDLFHLNMTTIISPKIRSVSLLFSGDEGRRLFKDKCSCVHDPCSNHARRRRRHRRHGDAERNMFGKAALAAGAHVHACVARQMGPCSLFAADAAFCSKPVCRCLASRLALELLLK